MIEVLKFTCPFCGGDELAIVETKRTVRRLGKTIKTYAAEDGSYVQVPFAVDSKIPRTITKRISYICSACGKELPLPILLSQGFLTKIGTEEEELTE